MNPQMEEDLGRWEAGTITLRELEGRHPDRGVTALTELHAHLVLLGREPTPEPSAGWPALRARLPERKPEVVSITRAGTRRSHARRVAVLGLAAALTLGGGLAMAGGLPVPAQTAVANLAGHLGLHLPHAEQAPPATTHGAEVSDLAHSTTAEGCAKGQTIAAAASAKAAAHRQDQASEHDPCGKAGSTGSANANAATAGASGGKGSRHAAHPNHGRRASSIPAVSHGSSTPGTGTAHASDRPIPPARGGRSARDG